MRRDNTPWRPVQAAALEWQEHDTPFSEHFEDVYYSRDNGLQESRVVFLQGNDLPRRWQSHNGGHFCIAETGFGTGLNFLMTWLAWRKLPQPRPDLHYVSVEKYPLNHKDLARCLQSWPIPPELSAALLDNYPGLLPGQHRLCFDGGRVRLDLWWEEAGEALADLAQRGQALVDAWYLDGFAPSRNESMWSSALLSSIATLSRPGATFATFTAAGQVRRDLQQAGFEVTKAPGYGRKRERLHGTIVPGRASPTRLDDTPWDIPDRRAPPPEQALVLGAGLAGCTIAAALARRGIRVTVLERDALATAGSGNEQGILYTRLSRKHSTLVDFALQSYRFASDFYRGMFERGELREEIDGLLCGNFQQSDKIEEMAVLRTALQEVPELAQVLDARNANALLGISQESGGYWYPGSGWLRPPAVCRALLDHPGIQLQENCGEVTLQRDGTQWQARSAGRVIAQATCAVVATGTSTQSMEQLNWLPLQSIRGQTTQIPASPGTLQLQAGLCHEGYIPPARQGSHCIGATFDVHDSDNAARTADHRHNIERLATAVPEWREALTSLDPGSLKGRVGYRCASPDYLPAVGPVPEYTAFVESFADLRRNAKQTITHHGAYLPGLYLSTAHGSRGLSSAPLTAELLASMICTEPGPLSRELSRALAPARFIIRDLSRNRI